MASSNPNNPPEVPRKTLANRRGNFQPMPPAPTQPPTKPDPFYGQEEISRLCARFITHLFACPENPPAASQSQAKLPYFIAYAFHRTKLHPSVTFAALILLQRLKARFPTARGSSGHRLFLSAFMIASKIICDDTYSNKSWTIVGQGMFNLREINQMEREMCLYLDWELTVDNTLLTNFESMVRRDFKAAEGPYPMYSLQMVSKRAVRAAASASATPLPEPHSTTSPIPMFGHHGRHPSPSASESSPKRRKRSKQYVDSPPETPSPSYSASTSPASSASPATPVGPNDFTAKIRGIDSPLGFSISRHRQKDRTLSHPLKTRMFSLASTTLW
ncbi:uncharacterized protein ARMOST_01090 [Armillaria ostoyae]|uniref:Cyclin N-terminal domain-containing protein n=3 Tax=Armillaria TaxID=47424 RepID=A0A284QMY6_ARMOS|nr:hypothetical protein EV421DRAFT_1887218 [Armillaria borealis]PBK74198.1 hypothetical protein ARMSODRAFT_951793 [Armillaria solidipes]SJK97835.1 uncharacterized protein ARMOST_01090 [Armillaria ostoyae]